MKFTTQFHVNYLRMNQFKADRIEAKIERHYALWDDLVLLKQTVADIKADAEHDGLTDADKVSIHHLQDGIFDTLKEIDKLPEFFKLNERLDHLEHKIERHAEMWNIDSW